MKLLLLVLLLVFSLNSFAQDKRGYSSYPEAIELAEKIYQKYQNLSQENPSIELNTYHLEGKVVDEYLDSILLYLKERNVPITSTFITKKEFIRQHKEFLNFSSNRLSGQDKLMILRKSDFSQKGPIQVTQSFRSLIKQRINQFFGTPKGLSFWSFYRKNNKRVYPTRVDGKLTSGEKKQRFLTKHTVVAAALPMLASQILRYDLQKPLLEAFQSMKFDMITASMGQLMTWDMMAPVIAMSGYVAFVAYYARELSQFKNQGLATLYTAKASKTINTVKNKLFYYTSTIAVSLAANSVVMMTLVGKELFTPAYGLNTLFNSFIGNFVKIPFEYAIDKIFQAADKARGRGEIELAEKLHSRASKIKVVWSYIYSTLKNIHLVAPILIEAGPVIATATKAIWIGFNAIGVISLVADISRYRTNIRNLFMRAAQSFKKNSHTCENFYLDKMSLFRFKTVETNSGN